MKIERRETGYLKRNPDGSTTPELEACFGLSGYLIAETQLEKDALGMVLDVARFFESVATRRAREDNDWRTTAKHIGAANAYELIGDYLSECIERSKLQDEAP